MAARPAVWRRRGQPAEIEDKWRRTTRQTLSIVLIMSSSIVLEISSTDETVDSAHKPKQYYHEAQTGGHEGTATGIGYSIMYSTHQNIRVCVVGPTQEGFEV